MFTLFLKPTLLEFIDFVEIIALEADNPLVLIIRI